MGSDINSTVQIIKIVPLLLQRDEKRRNLTNWVFTQTTRIV